MTEYVPRAKEDPMGALCRMVVGTKYADLPADIVKHAKYAILDTMAVTIGGSAMEGIPAVVELVKARGGTPESVIPFYGGRVPAPEAGLAIGPMARAMDCGDIHEAAGHSSEYILPAMLAALGLRKKITGREFITAFTVGKEIMVRIGMAWRIDISFPLGRGEGHAIFGAVAAVGKMLGLNLTELTNAQGIARALTQPHDLAMFSPATLVGRVHHGFVCHDAINACLLAQKGITGPRQEVLAGPRGYLGMAKWDTDPGALTRGLGEKWEMLRIIVKGYPCCGVLHTAIDALSAQMQGHRFEARDIAGIRVELSAPGWQMSNPYQAKWHPRTAAECQFSLPYVLATIACSGHIFLDSFTPEAMARRDVRDLMMRIVAEPDPSLPNLAARVHTTLKDGRTLTRECRYCKGHYQNPFTERELAAKFRQCAPYAAFKIGEKVIDSVIKAILHLEDIRDVESALLLPLTP